MRTDTAKIMEAFETWWNEHDHPERDRAAFLEAWLEGAIAATRVERDQAIEELLQRGEAL